jgi:hypothetical protein
VLEKQKAGKQKAKKAKKQKAVDLVGICDKIDSSEEPDKKVSCRVGNNI